MRFRRSVGAAIPTRVASTTGATAGVGARATTPSRIWHGETSGGGEHQSVAFILFGNTSANFDASRNQSHHMSKPRDSHQLGNQTQKRVSKTVCMGSSYTPRCGISVMDFWPHRISTGQTPKIAVRPEISPKHAHVTILSVCSRRLAAKYREFV